MLWFKSGFPFSIFPRSNFQLIWFFNISSGFKLLSLYFSNNSSGFCSFLKSFGIFPSVLYLKFKLSRLLLFSKFHDLKDLSLMISLLIFFFFKRRTVSDDIEIVFNKLFRLSHLFPMICNCLYLLFSLIFDCFCLFFQRFS